MANDVERVQLRELLESFSDQELADALGPRLYVTNETVAKQLSVTQATIRKWVKEEVIPDCCYIQVGSTYRFNLSRVIEILETNTNPDRDLPDPKKESKEK